MLIIVGFLVLVFIYQYFTPKEFVWNPTFYQYDKQPFGSYVFDDVMSSSTTDYQIENKTFYQLYLQYGGAEVLDEDSDYDETEVFTPARRAFLVTEERAAFTAVDVKAMLHLLRQGCQIMLCLHSIPSALSDSVGFTSRYDLYFDPRAIIGYARSGNSRDSLLAGIDSLHPEKIYKVYPHLHPVVLEEDSTAGNLFIAKDTLKKREKPLYDRAEVLVRNVKGAPIAIRLSIGSGALFLVTTPLMFTNYGILDGENASYAFWLLSSMKDLPVTRLEAYGKYANQESGSPLRYFLRQPSLQWAVYMAVAVILLSMFFGMKRRQWIIPVLHPPANETLRFTQLIGNLYYQRKDYKDILQKKYLYFCTDVKQLTGLDLQSDESDEELCRRLSDKMGQDHGAVRPLFMQLKQLLKPDVFVDENAMMRMIDLMNGWKRNLKT